MKVGIASNRGSACRGEYVPGLVHPPVTPWELVSTLSRCANRKEAADHGKVSDWGEVVTR